MATKSKDKELVLEPVNTTKPANPCRNCSSNDWWQRQDGGFACPICHPKP